MKQKPETGSNAQTDASQTEDQDAGAAVEDDTEETTSSDMKEPKGKRGRNRNRNSINRSDEDETEQVDPFANITRKQLKSALGEDSDIRAKDMMRAIRQANTPEEALAGMASKAAEQGERMAMTKFVPPTVSQARIRFRHFLVLLSFLIVVVSPTAAAFWYLTERAVPQFASITAFSVRQEDHSSPTDVLGTAFGLTNTSTNDTDILYDFLTSQEVVSAIRKYRDFEEIWTGAGSDWETGDPIFAMPRGGTIEEQTAYWNRMVSVSYDTSASILEVQVLAFDPDAAQMIAQDILNESTSIINKLSSIATQDVLRYAQEDLETAEAELRTARGELTNFRNQYQIASIDSDIALTTGPLNALTQQLVEAKIEKGLLGRDTNQRDPRLIQINARIEVIEQQIEEERSKLGAAAGDDEGSVLSNRIAEFERLNVELKFAESSYENSLAAFYAARADANRQSVYLAAHKNPTLAERADYPKKWLILGLIAGLCFALWGIFALMALSLRDRR